MCGIVGYIDQGKAYPTPIKGLKRLEHRGYDSAGVALISDGRQLDVYRTKGKVSDLGTFITQKDISGGISTAHTHWATHGEPYSINAHPYYSSSERLALIRNDIIESYTALKDKLRAKGYTFKNSADAEVLIQLIEYIQVTNHIDLLTAVQLALQEVAGAYVIAMFDRKSPGEVIAARKSSPLVVSIGQDEFFLTSDVTPIVECTDKVIYLEDGEIAAIHRGEKLKAVNLENVECLHEVKTVTLNLGQLEKGEHPHFTPKETFEQPGCIHDCVCGHIDLEDTSIMLSAIIGYKEHLLTVKRFVIIACGTLRRAALIDKHLIESFCRAPVRVEYVLEFRYRDLAIDGSDMVITVLQSGETTDTLAAVKLAKGCGVFTYGICNAMGSSVSHATHTGSYIRVGPEIGVTSAKAFTGWVTVFTTLVLALAYEKHIVDEEQYLAIARELGQVPEKMREVLKLNNSIAELSRIFAYARDFIYLGRGYSYPVALEGVLKLKEISYIYVESYPAAETKHGPIAPAGAEMPVVVVATQNGLYEKMLSSIQEIKVHKGGVITIVTGGDGAISKVADTCIELPGIMERLDPLITAAPPQLLAYHITVCKGMDVDQPCDLAKSVTVE